MFELESNGEHGRPGRRGGRGGGKSKVVSQRSRNAVFSKLAPRFLEQYRPSLVASRQLEILKSWPTPPRWRLRTDLTVKCETGSTPRNAATIPGQNCHPILMAGNFQKLGGVSTAKFWMGRIFDVAAKAFLSILIIADSGAASAPIKPLFSLSEHNWTA